MERRTAFGLSVVVFVAVTGLAGAAALKGKVAIRGELPAPQETRGRYYWQAENGVLPIVKTRLHVDRDVAVVLHGAAPSGPLKTRYVRMIDGGLKPAALVVRPGTLVRFENNDPLAHELFAVDPEKAGGREWFRAEATSRGTSRDVRFSVSGIHEIRCRRTPHLRGWVAVENVTAMATPDADGSFRFEDVTPGSYRLRTFFAGRWIADQPVEVEDVREQEVEVEATLRPEPSAAAPASASPGGATAAPAASAAPGR